MYTNLCRPEQACAVPAECRETKTLPELRKLVPANYHLPPARISGHTHGGQVFPFTWITRRAFGKFTYGLQVFGALQVYTSSGAGTWGPPMRVGTHPEMVLLTFE